MKIAINILPLKTGHKDRGIGFYTSNLLENLKRDPEIDVQEFTGISEVKQADIVHYSWFDFFFHTLPLRKKFRTIVTIHDVIPLLFPKHYPTGLRGKCNFILQKLALKSCDHIITDSNSSKKDISKYLKVNENKISVIYLAANEKFRVQNDTNLIHIKRKYKLPGRFLLYVGDANWVKNLPFLITSFHKISGKKEFSDLKLVLIGGVFLKKVENIDHPELESLKFVNRLIKELYLEEKVLRMGDLDLEELISFYNLATVYIQPSLYEGFGLPILEAMSCGVPVVSSIRGSLPEVGGEAVVYFDPENDHQFRSIIEEILENKSLRDKLSGLSLKQAEKFSWERVVMQTKQVYSNIIKSE